MLQLLLCDRQCCGKVIGHVHVSDVCLCDDVEMGTRRSLFPIGADVEMVKKCSITKACWIRDFRSPSWCVYDKKA